MVRSFATLLIGARFDHVGPVAFDTSIGSFRNDRFPG